MSIRTRTTALDQWRPAMCSTTPFGSPACGPDRRLWRSGRGPAKRRAPWPSAAFGSWLWRSARAWQNGRGRTSLVDVTVRTTSFEAWDPGGAKFDAVFACNSFHLVDPDVRFVKTAAVLGPKGHLIVLTTPWVIPESADRFWWDVQDDYVAVGAERVDPATKHPDLVGDLGPAVRASGLFEKPATTRYRFDVTSRRRSTRPTCRRSLASRSSRPPRGPS